MPVVETDWERWDAGLNTTWEGPGHGSVLEDSVGDWWLVYHSWNKFPVVVVHQTRTAPSRAGHSHVGTLYCLSCFLDGVLNHESEKGLYGIRPHPPREQLFTVF